MVKQHLAFLAVVLGLTVAFAIGIILGWSLSTAQATDASKVLKENELNTESFLLEQELFATLGSQGCGLTESRLNDLSQQLYALGLKLGTPTAERDLGQDTYSILKRRFHLLQIKTYTLYYRFKQSCRMQNPIILFYYSRNDPESEEQGGILDSFVAKHDARVFAIEFGYAPELVFLEQYYGVRDAPAIIMDYTSRFEGLVTAEALEKALAAPAADE